MAQTEIKAAPRAELGKGPTGRLRAAGKVPGVVYGGDGAPESIMVDGHDFEALIHHGLNTSSLINLDIEGKQQLVLMRVLQREPVGHRVNHVDFYRVRLDQKVEFEIPVHETGTSPGVRTGGIIEHVTRTVTVRCVPTDAPHHFEVSVETLDFDHSIAVSEIALPAGVELVTDPATVLFSVVLPRVVVAAAEEAEGEGEGEEGAEGEEGEEKEAAEGEEKKEPEVIGKGKKEEGAGD